MSSAMYLQCGRCDARWRGWDLPTTFDTFISESRKAICPHCGSRSKDHYLCDTTGPHAVTRSRKPDPDKLAAALAKPAAKKNKNKKKETGQ